MLIFQLESKALMPKWQSVQPAHNPVQFLFVHRNTTSGRLDIWWLVPHRKASRLCSPEGGTARRTLGNGVDGFDSPWHANRTTGGVLLQMGMQVGIRQGRRERGGPLPGLCRPCSSEVEAFFFPVEHIWAEVHNALHSKGHQCESALPSTGT